MRSICNAEQPSSARHQQRSFVMNKNSLPSSGKAITSQTDLKNERRIKRAIHALAGCDDQVLRDMGIRDRSQIELTVRFCHEC